MEDTTRVSVSNHSAFFGVYDGHGGSEAAEFCSDHLHENLSQAIAHQWRGTPLLDCNDRDCVTKISQCMRDAFVHTDHLFLTRELNHPKGGTTACVAVLLNDTIVVGNVGDTRAILYRGNSAVPLSKDHKPDRVDEIARIQAAGGDVIAGDVVVGGEEFSLTRAIGNSTVKVRPGQNYRDLSVPQVVTSEPEVSITELNDDDKFLIIASDGVWDYMTNEDVVEFVEGRLNVHQDPQMAAKELAEHAIKTLRSSDNVSVIIVVPRNPRLGQNNQSM